MRFSRVFILVLLLLPVRAYGWGGDGHRLTCGVAWRRLTPEARTMAARLLGGTDEKTFDDACAWADQIRGEHPETYNYHFINIPAGQTGLDMARDCTAPKRCAPWAIAHYAAILTNGKSTHAEKSDALKFIMHFVGDLHQPLHAGRPGDRGGNDIPVDFFGDVGNAERRMNLHSVWDSQILRRAGITWPSYADTLIADLSADEAKKWETADVAGWANESYQLCEDFVYGDLPSGGWIRNAYYRPALGHVQVQLQKAGVRMAYLINRLAAGDKLADLRI